MTGLSKMEQLLAFCDWPRRTKKFDGWSVKLTAPTQPIDQ